MTSKAIGLLKWVGVAVVVGVATVLAVRAWDAQRGLPLETARTMAVNTLVVMEIFYLFSVRYVHGTALTWRGVTGTPAVLTGIGAVAVVQLVFTYLPALQAVFDTRPISLADGLAIMATGVILLLLVEAEKWLGRRLTRIPAVTHSG